MIKFDKLWILTESRNITIKELKQGCNISDSTVKRMKKNEHISTATVNKLCRFLNCGIGDIMEHSK